MNINTPEYWNNQWSKRPQRIYPYYAKIAELCKGKKVLDFGCGRGDLLEMLGENAEGIDISSVGVGIARARGLNVVIGNKPEGQYDIIVATEVLEHLDDDKGMIERFFEHAPVIIYAVPNNCLGPEEEPEHQRKYTSAYIKSITPHLKRIFEIDGYFVVMASKEEMPLAPSVLAAIPNEGQICAEMGFVVARLANYRECETKIYMPQARPIDNNRNQIVKKFLEGTWDYLLMIDSDNPPKRNPLELVKLDKDVIACPTPQWNDEGGGYPLYFVAMDKVKEGYREHKEKRGLQEVDAIGAGCILIARRVLEKVKAPFMRIWNEEGIADLGLDFNFCEKAKEQGFKIWAHYDYPCSHYKTIDLLKVFNL